MKRTNHSLPAWVLTAMVLPGLAAAQYTPASPPAAAESGTAANTDASLARASAFYAEAKYAEALAILGELSTANDVRAKRMLCAMYVNGFGVAKSFDKALALATEIEALHQGEMYFMVLNLVKQKNQPADGNYDRYLLPPPGPPGVNGFPMRTMNAGADGLFVQLTPGFDYHVVKK